MNKCSLMWVMLVFVLGLSAQVPEWEWANSGGGESNDHAFSIGLDSTGNSIITGYYRTSATFGDVTLNSIGTDACYVAKLNPAGEWVWAVNSTGSGNVYPISLKVCSNDDVIIAGDISGSVHFGNTSLNTGEDEDIFIARMDNDGNWLWAIQTGGDSWINASDITLDSAGNIYITGSFEGTANFGNTTLTSNGYYDVFVAKLDSAGNWLWATSAGGPDIDVGQSVAVDLEGNITIIGGFFISITIGSQTFTSNGASDIFCARLDPQGNWLWATSAGGFGDDNMNRIAVDRYGNSYVTGRFEMTADFGYFVLTSLSAKDLFVAKIDSSGNWIWARRGGGTGNDGAYGITVDNDNNVYFIGSFSGVSYFGMTYLVSYGLGDILVTKLTSDGGWLWATSTGGCGSDYGWGIAVDAEGSVFVTGYFEFTINFGDEQFISNGRWDVFVAKLSELTPNEDTTSPLTHTGLINAYPNPFILNTNIEYFSKDSSPVKVDIYNVKGQLVRTLSDNTKAQGNHIINWDGNDNQRKIVGSGLYFVSMNSGNHIFTTKLLKLGS